MSSFIGPDDVDHDEEIEAYPYTLIGEGALHPKEIPPIHDYEVTLRFSTRDSRQAVEAFFEELLPALPNGTRTAITTNGEAINVEDLTFEHWGMRIRLVVDGRTIEGKLDAIYTTGVGSGVSQTLIIDGKAYALSFGVAEINV